MNDVITKDEDMYGFIEDIVDTLKYDLKQSIDNNEPDQELLEALDEAINLLNKDDTKFYKVSFHPMGSYVFQEMIIKED